MTFGVTGDVTGDTAGPTVADQHLHPGTIALGWLSSAPSTIIGLPAIIAITSDIGFRTALLAMLGLGLVSLAFGYWRWTRFTYGIGTQDIVIESGLLSRNRRTIPFSRIQDVDIERKLLHRIFGLAKVNVESGGGGEDEGSLDSVSDAEADRIRSTVRAAKGAAVKALTEAQTQAQTQDQAQAGAILKAVKPDTPLFAMSLSQVLKYGLFSYSFGSLAAIMGGIFYLYSQLRDTLDEQAELLNQAKGYAGDIVISPLWITIGIIIILLLAMITSVGKALLTTYDFQLTQDARGLRCTRGLLTRTEVLIPKNKVQAGIIASNPLWAIIAHEALFLQTLGVGSASGNHNAAPFATRAEVSRIVDEVPALRLPDGIEYSSASSVHRWNQIAAVPFLVIMAIAIGWLIWWVAIILLPLILIFASGRWLAATRHGYALDNNMLFINSGFWRQRLAVVRMANIESVSITSGWIQRRWGLASVTIDIAGGCFAIQDVTRLIANSIADDLIAMARQERRSGHPKLL